MTTKKWYDAYWLTGLLADWLACWLAGLLACLPPLYGSIWAKFLCNSLMFVSFFKFPFWAQLNFSCFASIIAPSLYEPLRNHHMAGSHLSLSKNTPTVYQGKIYKRNRGHATRTRRHVWIYVSMYACMHVYMYACMRAYMHVCYSIYIHMFQLCILWFVLILLPYKVR